LASAFVSVGVVPLALAVAVAPLFMTDSARTLTESAVMLRASSAVVVQPVTTLIATSAPTAVLLPTASASAFVCEYSAVWIAVIATAPVSVGAGPDPSRAVTASSRLMRRATTGVTAVPPSEPPFASVRQQRSLVALMVRSSPVARTTPFSTSARVSDGWRKLNATEAPTPLFSPSALAVARAMSLSEWMATTVMSPAPALMVVVPVVPALITAAVSTSTMLSARAPATPMSVLPAPDFAVASNSCMPLAPGGPFMFAPTHTPTELIVTSLRTMADVRAVTQLTAAAAPIPVALLFDDPSARAEAP
jgi:hypothetical protein